MGAVQINKCHIKERLAPTSTLLPADVNTPASAVAFLSLHCPLLAALCYCSILSRHM